MLKDTITASDIDVLRQLGEGWNDIWTRVIKKLLGNRMDGPLYRQAKLVCLISPENSRRLAALREDNEYDDGVEDEESTDEAKDEESPDRVEDKKSADGVKDKKSDDEVEDEEYSDGGGFSRVAYLVSPEDLVSYIYKYYDRRLKNGTLLTNFEAASPETAESDLIAYLCSSSYLSRLMHACRREQMPRFSRDEREKYLNYAESFNTGRFIEENETFEVLRKNTSERFTRLRPNCGPRFSVIDLHAGLQLYPRLDEESGNNHQLQEGVHQTLAEVPGSTPDERIRAEHQSVAKAYDEELQQIREEILERNVRLRMRQKRTNELTEKYDAKYFESIFIPLESESITHLTGETKDAAYQKRHRYHKKLPAYFPDLLELYRRLKEMREERGEKIERWSDNEEDD